jgi:hypothetical protein
MPRKTFTKSKSNSNSKPLHKKTMKRQLIIKEKRFMRDIDEITNIIHNNIVYTSNCDLDKRIAYKCLNSDKTSGCGLNVLTYLDLITRKDAVYLHKRLKTCINELKLLNPRNPHTDNCFGASFDDYIKLINHNLPSKKSGFFYKEINFNILSNERVDKNKIEEFYKFLSYLPDNSCILAKINRNKDPEKRDFYSNGHAVAFGKKNGKIYSLDPQQEKTRNYNKERLQEIKISWSKNKYESISVISKIPIDNNNAIIVQNTLVKLGFSEEPAINFLAIFDGLSTNVKRKYDFPFSSITYYTSQNSNIRIPNEIPSSKYPHYICENIDTINTETIYPNHDNKISLFEHALFHHNGVNDYMGYYICDKYQNTLFQISKNNDNFCEVPLFDEKHLYTLQNMFDFILSVCIKNNYNPKSINIKLFSNRKIVNNVNNQHIFNNTANYDSNINYNIINMPI